MLVCTLSLAEALTQAHRSLHTHLRRLRSTSSRGRHSRCLWGPGEGFGAYMRRIQKWHASRFRAYTVPHPNLASCKRVCNLCCCSPLSSLRFTQPVHVCCCKGSHETAMNPWPGWLSRTGLIQWSAAQAAQQQAASILAAVDFLLPPGAAQLHSCCWKHCVGASHKRAGPLTKMPPSLSNIQWEGAFSLFMCFFGPRTYATQP